MVLQIWNLLENKDLFGQIHSSDGKYNCRKHIAQMIAFLGYPPKELLDREREARNWKWKPPIQNSEGKICTSVNDCFGGPFFDSHGKKFRDFISVNCSHNYANNTEGEFLYKDLIPGDLDLRDSTPSLQGEEKQLFLEFVGKMLRWVPEDRKTAKELLADPWLLRDAPSKG